VRQGLERSEQRRTDDWTSISSGSSAANRIRIPGAQHLNFTDAALAADGATAEQRWMKFGPVEPARALTMTAELVRAFFDQTFERAKL